MRDGLNRFAEEQQIAASQRLYMLRDVDAKHLDIEQNIQDVATMSPVAFLTGQEFQKSDRSLFDRVAEYYRKLGNTAESPSIGVVELGHVGIKKTLSTKLNKFKAAAFAAVPKIVEQGKIISAVPNWKSKGYDTVVVAAPISINKENLFAAAVIRLMDEKNAYYVHDVLIERGTASPSKTGADTTRSPSGRSHPSIVSLLQQVDGVNKGLKSDNPDIRYSDRPRAPVMYSKMQQEDQPLHSERNYDDQGMPTPRGILAGAFGEVAKTQAERRNAARDASRKEASRA